MGTRIFEIVIKGEDYFHCDDDGFVMVFDSPEQILAWAREVGIDPDTITYFEDEVLDEEELTFNTDEVE